MEFKTIVGCTVALTVISILAVSSLIVSIMSNNKMAVSNTNENDYKAENLTANTVFSNVLESETINFVLPMNENIGDTISYILPSTAGKSGDVMRVGDDGKTVVWANNLSTGSVRCLTKSKVNSVCTFRDTDASIALSSNVFITDDNVLQNVNRLWGKPMPGTPFLITTEVDEQGQTPSITVSTAEADNAKSGSVKIGSGNNSSLDVRNKSGNIVLKTGDVLNGSSGNINIANGSTEIEKNGEFGNMTIRTGVAENISGDLNIFSGSTGDRSGSKSGSINLGIEDLANAERKFFTIGQDVIDETSEVERNKLAKTVINASALSYNVHKITGNNQKLLGNFMNISEMRDEINVFLPDIEESKFSDNYNIGSSLIIVNANNYENPKNIIVKGIKPDETSFIKIAPGFAAKFIATASVGQYNGWVTKSSYQAFT